MLLLHAYFAAGPTERLAAGVRIVLACWVLTLAVNVIMRKQWIENERYPLPLGKISATLLGLEDEEDESE